MEQILNSLKTLIDPLAGKAAATLGEDEHNVSKAVSGILPALLVRLAAKGNSPQVENAIMDAARANVLPHLSAVFGTKGEVEQKSIGNRLFRALTGDKSENFIYAVSEESGLSEQSAHQLTDMISTAVAGYFGDKITNGGYSLGSLASELNKEK